MRLKSVIAVVFSLLSIALVIFVALHVNQFFTEEARDVSGRQNLKYLTDRIAYATADPSRDASVILGLRPKHIIIGFDAAQSAIAVRGRRTTTTIRRPNLCIDEKVCVCFARADMSWRTLEVDFVECRALDARRITADVDAVPFATHKLALAQKQAATSAWDVLLTGSMNPTVVAIKASNGDIWLRPDFRGRPGLR